MYRSRYDKKILKNSIYKPFFNVFHIFFRKKKVFLKIRSDIKLGLGIYLMFQFSVEQLYTRALCKGIQSVWKNSALYIQKIKVRTLK